MMQLAEACPRFDRCAVNNCPLHSDYGGRLEAHPADPEQRCRLPKSRRLAIVAKYPDLSAWLQTGGLTPREWGAAKAYEKLTEHQKRALSDMGRQNIRLINRALRIHRETTKKTRVRAEIGGSP